MSNNSVNVFLSHSDKDKKIAAELKTVLSPYNIKVFVAHDDIDGGAEWMSELYEEIQNCDVFFMLLSENYHGSTYTDQETGIALNCKKPVLPICIDETRPYGFTAKYQGVICKNKFDDSTIKKIVEISEKYASPEPSILDELIKRLANAYSYSEAASLANRIETHTKFTKDQIDNLATAYLTNHEVSESFIATPIIMKILRKNIDKLDPAINRSLSL